MYTTSISLLEQLRRPDQPEAWSRFVKLYTPLFFYWAKSWGLQDTDAADLVQEVFVVLVNQLPEFHYEKPKSFRAWLHTVMLNKWRELHRRQVIPLIEFKPSVFDELIAPDNVDAFGEAEYRQRLVGRALQLMQVDFEATTWKACWECVVHDRPAAEVAQSLGISVGAVRVAKSRVLQRLRLELTDLWD
jgi:RNA polymerase sigma-70 factor (ECF subfamily)